MATGQHPEPAPGEMAANAALESPVMVIGQEFVTQHPVDLEMMNDCKVTDEDGNLIFQVRSKIATVRDIRYLQDAYGNILVSLKHKLMTAHGRWEVFRGESIEQKDLLFSVKQSSLFQLVSSKLHVFLPSNTTESVPDFRIEGAFIDSSCTIYLGNSNTIVAQVSSKPVLTVSPNVDYAFIIVLVVILDATEDNDDKT
ncbi:protein LURP-one-related 10-like [Populus alba x Populus x berolinensis]|uniref:Protein LURP-one-related 10-like n=2 Tax=Populus alba x Populus x berolinensis TaxID=444605 RepID=A0AAD6LKY5_9ROSI|nr:protein LURP-one-related 10-like [Populus alba x Populus x berolinensis]